MQQLFMVLLGSKPEGRLTEQHDIFFGIAGSLSELKKDFRAFWPEAQGQIHIDAWRPVTLVDGHAVQVIPRNDAVPADGIQPQLFFLNLGGYKPGDFEEYHYKMVLACTSKAVAIQKAKASAFYKHTGFEGASSHIDDKYGIDVDDIYAIEDILPDYIKQQFALKLTAAPHAAPDEWHIGYVKLSTL